MSYKLPLPLLNHFTKYFNALSKAGINFDIEVSHTYDPAISDYRAKLTPRIKGVKSLKDIAVVWSAGTSSISVNQMEDSELLQNFYKKPNTTAVRAAHYKQTNPSVKFYAESVFSKLPQLGVYLLTAPPVETRSEEHTYRVCCTSGEYYSSDIVFCGSEDNQYFNYIDQGHIIVTTSAIDKPESYMFVTNRLTLDMNYIIAAFITYPDCVTSILQNGAFIRAEDVRNNLARVEKGIPPRFQMDYQKLKGEILADFEKNAQNVMIGKLTRNETPYVDLNNIRISKTKAVYTAGNVSIEADNLAEVIFSALNPNEEWDIFTLVNIYTDWVEKQFKVLPLNASGFGFKEKKVFNFKINNIPLKVECFVDNTRRAINDNLINIEELSKTMRRAACYLEETDRDNVKDYNNFIKEVSRISLKLRDILANGLPVKTIYLDSDQNSGAEATNKHPKLRFTYKDKKGFYLVVNHLNKKGKLEKTEERQVSKMAEFTKKVESLNRRSYFYSYYNNEYERTHEGGWERKDGQLNACASKLVLLLNDYAAGITEEDKKVIIGSINKELSEAEKRSEELLQEAVTLVKAKKGERKGKPGYIIPGKLRNYFVEEDTLKVYDYDNRDNPNIKDYICVVNGHGDQGIGRDSLVARIYALHNDSMITKQVGTLRRQQQ